MTKRYKVGNHYFSIDAPDGIIRDDYSIFSTRETTGEDVFFLKVDYEPVGMEGYVEEVMQEEEIPSMGRILSYVRHLNSL